jgi:hypothetical protein
LLLIQPVLEFDHVPPFHIQVMPWHYVHLISSVTTLYLTFYSFHQGLGFMPGTTVLHGAVLPFINVAILAMACVGLLIVGASLANPLGSDTVDFAVLTFLRSGAVNSRLIIEVQRDWIDRKRPEHASGESAAVQSRNSSAASTSSPQEDFKRPKTFRSKLLDSYDGALGGKASTLRRHSVPSSKSCTADKTSRSANMCSEPPNAACERDSMAGEGVHC